MKCISLLVTCSITAILIINSSLPIGAAATIPTLKEAITLQLDPMYKLFAKKYGTTTEIDPVIILAENMVEKMIRDAEKVIEEARIREEKLENKLKEEARIREEKLENKLKEEAQKNEKQTKLLLEAAINQTKLLAEADKNQTKLLAEADKNQTKLLANAESFKSHILPFAIDVFCAHNVRWSMETFNIDKMIDHTRVSKPSPAFRNAIKMITKKLKIRSKKIYEAVSILYQQYQAYPNMSVAALIVPLNLVIMRTWENNVETAYRTLNKIVIDETKYDHRPNQAIGKYEYEHVLVELVNEFRNSGNPKSATKIFREQCRSCRWSRVKFDIFEKYNEFDNWIFQIPDKEINSILTIPFGNKTGSTTHMITSDELPEPTKLTTEECEFVKKLLETRTRFRIDNSERYEKCAAVFHYAYDKQWNEFNTKLSKAWPASKSYFEKVDMFCDIFTKVYNEISLMKIHSAKVFPKVDGVCPPNSTDYHEFLQRIARLAHVDHVEVVIDILQLTPSKTTTLVKIN